jgi:hypothetical protein
MAYFLFLDESGHDHRQSPYEVLAGIAVEDRDIWNLIRSIHSLELEVFGTEYRLYHDELKAKKLLNTKTFKKANSLPPIPIDERRTLAATCIKDGANTSWRAIAALSQAKLEYARKLLELCVSFRVRLFASILVSPLKGRLSNPDFLRKDFVLIFDRFYLFLESHPAETMGCIVFDELEKTQSRVLTRQMDKYFKNHAVGRAQASLVIPEPFFVHSDLTTGIQLADIVAYLVSWGLRFGPLTAPARAELAPYIDLLKPMRHRVVERAEGGVERELWSTVAIFDQVGSQRQ